MSIDRLKAALADRYTIERELGQGGMATMLAAESRGSLGVAQATVLAHQPDACRFSDISRAVALATSSAGSAR